MSKKWKYTDFKVLKSLATKTEGETKYTIALMLNKVEKNVFLQLRRHRVIDEITEIPKFHEQIRIEKEFWDELFVKPNLVGKMLFDFKKETQKTEIQEAKT